MGWAPGTAMYVYNGEAWWHVQLCGVKGINGDVEHFRPLSFLNIKDRQRNIYSQICVAGGNDAERPRQYYNCLMADNEHQSLFTNVRRWLSILDNLLVTVNSNVSEETSVDKSRQCYLTCLNYLQQRMLNTSMYSIWLYNEKNYRINSCDFAFRNQHHFGAPPKDEASQQKYY